MILVLDLDDTIYDERAFVESGFAAVAAMLAPVIGVPEADLHERMAALLDEHGRGRIFDQLLAEQGNEDPDLVADCVRTYREHSPAIGLRPEVRDLLTDLGARFPLYLVTDGDPGVQNRKIDALGIRPLFRDCLCTWSFGQEAAKPSLTCFRLIREREGAEWADLVYVGDDPSKDFVNLRKAGATTVRVHRGRCASDIAQPGFDADVHVADVTEVPATLGWTEAAG